MKPDHPRAGLPAFLHVPALAIALGLVACGSTSDTLPDGAAPDGAGPDGATTGICGVGIPAGQACNAVVDNAPAISPTCTTGTIPVGTGGTILPGTYRLTAQTYYNVPICSPLALSGTITITAGCVESAIDTPVVASISSRLAISGNTATVTPNCIYTGGIPGTVDAPTRTFTASGTTVTFFILNSASGNPNPDRIEVYTRQ